MRTRFETEAQGNYEMTYYLALFFTLYPYKNTYILLLYGKVTLM